MLGGVQQAGDLPAMVQIRQAHRLGRPGPMRCPVQRRAGRQGAGVNFLDHRAPIADRHPGQRASEWQALVPCHPALSPISFLSLDA